jgi:hypothetical protein
MDILEPFMRVNNIIKPSDSVALGEHFGVLRNETPDFKDSAGCGLDMPETKKPMQFAQYMAFLSSSQLEVISLDLK